MTARTDQDENRPPGLPALPGRRNNPAPSDRGSDETAPDAGTSHWADIPRRPRLPDRPPSSDRDRPYSRSPAGIASTEPPRASPAAATPCTAEPARSLHYSGQHPDGEHPSPPVAVRSRPAPHTAQPTTRNLSWPEQESVRA